jgi:hypothetical protein
MTRDEFSAIEPAALGAVDIGDEANGTAQRVVVRALKVGQLPAFARAVRPLTAQVEALIAGGLSVNAVLALLEQHTDKVVEALAVATGASSAALNDSSVEQIGELLLAVLAANKDFLRGRLTAALRTAATLNPGAGQTPSQP